MFRATDEFGDPIERADLSRGKSESEFEFSDEENEDESEEGNESSDPYTLSFSHSDFNDESIQAVMSQINDRHEVLLLNNTDLTATGAKALAKALNEKKGHHIKIIDISGTKIGNEGAIALAGINHVEWLVLQNVGLNDGEQLRRAMDSNPTLRKANVANNSLSYCLYEKSGERSLTYATPMHNFFRKKQDKVSQPHSIQSLKDHNDRMRALQVLASAGLLAGGVLKHVTSMMRK